MAVVGDVAAAAGSVEGAAAGSAEGAAAAGAEGALGAVASGVGANGFVDLALGVHASSSNPLETVGAKAELDRGGACTGAEAGLKACGELVR